MSLDMHEHTVSRLCNGARTNKVRTPWMLHYENL
jgi:hypothetical protein